MQLHRDREKFEEAGVRVAVIGMGTPEQAAQFRKAQKIELDLLVDPERITYKAVGAKKATLGELIGPRVVLRGAYRGLRAGVRQGRTIGHPAQLGGVMLVLPDGSVPYAHLAEDASDNPPNDEVLTAIREAAAA